MSGVDVEDVKGSKEKLTVATKENLAEEDSLSSLGNNNLDIKKSTSRVDNIPTNGDAASIEVMTDRRSSEISSRGAVSSKTTSNDTRPASKTTTESSTTGFSNTSTEFRIVATSRDSSDSKIDSNSSHSRTERAEDIVIKPIVKPTVAVLPPKQTQQTQHQRYFVPSRQNQEEAVFKMVQNIFKLLETRGPLTMAQLEYNLPILLAGSLGSLSVIPQPMNTTAPKPNPASPNFAANKDSLGVETIKDNCNVLKTQSTDTKKPNSRTSFCEKNLIPGNMVPDIVELLLTLGLIQQQQQEAKSANSQLRNQPRFAVHFGKPKQFLITPTNILPEIAKAQAEIQFSRQRQELLKEALYMADEQAAEKVKHIVLQHPQVVDDPVYVTALRNLQVDGMLIAGISGNTTASNSNSTLSPKVRGGLGKSKPGFGGSGKNVGDGKRRQSGGIPARRKRQKQKKEVVSSGDANKYSGKKAITHHDDISISSQKKKLSKELSKLSASSTSTSDVHLSTQRIEGASSGDTNN